MNRKLVYFETLLFISVTIFAARLQCPSALRRKTTFRVCFLTIDVYRKFLAHAATLLPFVRQVLGLNLE